MDRLKRLLSKLDEAYDRPFRWQEGRQHGGYWKFMFMPTPGFRDGYVIVYPRGSSIRPHYDYLPFTVPGCLVRMNIILRQAEEGGVFRASQEECVHRFLNGRVILFRPD